MSKRTASVMAAVLMGFASVATANDLNLGDPAPKFEVAEFVKGTPVKSLEKGTIYVVEFWATWCGPCRTSIPHLTELQKKRKDVKFVGVSIWEQDQAGVKPFVKEMGDKMDYSVAMDSIPKDADADKGRMATGWMTAAGENGIPTAFIIDKTGKVAWIGHPMKLEAPLEKIIAGSYDLKAAIAERKAAKVEQEREAKIQKKLAQAEDPKALVKVIDEIVAESPDLEDKLAGMKFMALLDKDGDSEKAAEFGTKLTKGMFKDNSEALNMVAWTIVDPGAGKRSDKLIKLALLAATRADEIEARKNAQVADTLAKVYFDSGNAAKALETQERAIKLLDKDEEPATVTEMKQRLEQYRKAVKK